MEAHASLIPAAAPLTSLKRTVIRAMIASLLASGVLGIAALLAGDLGPIEIKVLLSSLVLAGVSLLSLAGAVHLERGRFRRLARAGVALAATSGALLGIGIWGEVNGEVFWRTTAIVGILAAAAAHLCLLLLALLPPRQRWIQWLAVVDVAVLAGMLSIAVAFDLGSELGLRVIAMLSIVAAVLSTVVPLLHRMAGGGGRRVARGGAPSACAPAGSSVIPVVCPHCAVADRAAEGEIQCGNCGGRYAVLLR